MGEIYVTFGEPDVVRHLILKLEISQPDSNALRCPFGSPLSLGVWVGRSDAHQSAGMTKWKCEKDDFLKSSAWTDRPTELDHRQKERGAVASWPGPSFPL